MHYSAVVIILFSAGLCKSAFFTYSHVKLGFRLDFIVLCLSLFIFLLNVLNLMSSQKN